MLRRPAVHRCSRAPPASKRPSATSKTKTTKTDPISTNRSQINILQRSPAPAPSSAAEIQGRGMASGFRSEGLEETRGFSRPGKPLIPPLPPGLPPTPTQPQTAENQTTKQTQSRRTHLNHQLAGPRSPSTRSVDLGFEIRGFSHPRNHESSANPPRPHSPPATPHRPSPKEPHPSKSAKPVCQTDPISLVHEISRPTKSTTQLRATLRGLSLIFASPLNQQRPTGHRAENELTVPRASESTAGIPRTDTPNPPTPRVTRFLSCQINNIPPKHPKTLDTAC